MDFSEKIKPRNNADKYALENLRLCRSFTTKLIGEMGELIRSIVIFGSNTTNTLTKDSDIDVMVVLNNVSVYVTPELREAYKIITDKITNELSDKFHILTVNLSDLWDMSRKGDPVLINILRNGLPLFDRDLIEPLQYLLETGKIRPSIEAINNYSSRSKTLLQESSFHLKEAIMDLYYAIIDAGHAYLMVKNELPPSPKEMPSLLKKHLKLKKHTPLLKTVQKMQKISKEIEHKKTTHYSGKEYDDLKLEVEKAILNLDELVKLELKQKDIFDL